MFDANGVRLRTVPFTQPALRAGRPALPDSGLWLKGAKTCRWPLLQGAGDAHGLGDGGHQVEAHRQHQDSFGQPPGPETGPVASSLKRRPARHGGMAAAPHACCRLGVRRYLGAGPSTAQGSDRVVPWDDMVYLANGAGRLRLVETMLKQRAGPFQALPEGLR